MNSVRMYEALRPALGDDNAQVVVDEIAGIRETDINRLKEVFATKVELKEEIKSLDHHLSGKIDEIYWLLGQTAILVGLILAILRIRMVNIF